MYSQTATGVSSSSGTTSVSTTPPSASNQTIVVKPPVLKRLDPMDSRALLKASIDYDPFKDSLATRICKLLAHRSDESHADQVFLALFHHVPTLTCADAIELLDNLNAAIRKFVTGHVDKERARELLRNQLFDLYHALAEAQTTNTRLQVMEEGADPVLLLIKGMGESLLPVYEGILPPSIRDLHEFEIAHRKTACTLAGQSVVLKARPAKAQKEKKQASPGEVKEKEKQKPSKKEKAQKEDKAKKAEKPEKEQLTEPESKDEGTVKEEKLDKKEKKKNRKSMRDILVNVGERFEEILAPAANPVASPRRKPSYKAHMEDLPLDGEVRGGYGPNFQGNATRENPLHEPDGVHLDKAISTPRTPASPRSPASTASTPSTTGAALTPASPREREKAQERKGKTGDESSDQ